MNQISGCTFILRCLLRVPLLCKRAYMYVTWHVCVLYITWSVHTVYVHCMTLYTIIASHARLVSLYAVYIYIKETVSWGERERKRERREGWHTKRNMSWASYLLYPFSEVWHAVIAAHNLLKDDDNVYVTSGSTVVHNQTPNNYWEAHWNIHLVFSGSTLHLSYSC